MNAGENTKPAAAASAALRAAYVEGDNALSD